jgi:hypothetical protein
MYRTHTAVGSHIGHTTAHTRCEEDGKPDGSGLLELLVHCGHVGGGGLLHFVVAVGHGVHQRRVAQTQDGVHPRLKGVCKSDGIFHYQESYDVCMYIYMLTGGGVDVSHGDRSGDGAQVLNIQQRLQAWL